MVALQAAILAVSLTSAGDTVLLDFYADWCGPCRQMDPVVRQLVAEGYPVRRVNVDQEKALASQYGITGIPCFVLVSGGRPAGRIVGATSGGALKQLFQAARSSAARRTAAPAKSLPSRLGGLLNPFGSKGRAPSSGSVDDRLVPPTVSLPSVSASTPTPTAASASSRSMPSAESSRFDPHAALAAAPARRDFSPSAPASGRSAASSGAGSTLLDMLMAASVRLKVNDAGGNNVGSGTVIDARDGEALILTCGHLFRDSKGQGRITVDFFGPDALEGVVGRLVSYDLDRDVALVAIRPGRAVTAIPLAGAGYAIRPGDEVISIGCNHGSPPTAQRSRVSSVDKFLGPPNVQVAGMPVEGRSGGGLFTADGRVIGVCNAADPADNEGLYAALPSVRAKLDELGLATVLDSASRGGSNERGLADAEFASPPPLPARMPRASLAAEASSPSSAVGSTAGSSPSNALLAASTGMTADETAAMGELRRLAEAAEVICIVRPLSDPRAKTEIIRLDHASPEFVEQLTAEVRVQQGRHLTSYDEPAPQSTSAPDAYLTTNGRMPWSPAWVDPAREAPR